jgi:small-conductance mechanosensitive channel
VHPHLWQALVAAGLFIGSLVALLFARRSALRALTRWSAATVSSVDNDLLAAARTPSLALVVALALAVTVHASDVAPALRAVMETPLSVVLVVSFTAMVANASGEMLQHAIERVDPSGRVPGIGRVVVKLLVWLLGALVTLNLLEVEIAPLLTALGVGGLAVALAMQETLGNLFAGLHILLERPFRVGDFVRLEDGQTGHVHDISWRTTRIKTMDDDFIVVPNSKLAGSQLLNHHLLHRRSRLQVDVTLPYGADVDTATRTLHAALGDAREPAGILDTPAPDVLLLRLGTYALEFRLRFFITDFADQPGALDKVNRAVLRRLAESAIPVAVPVQRVVLDREEHP